MANPTPAHGMEIEHAGSAAEDERGAGGPSGSKASSTTAAKAKKPKDSAFKQQRLPAWQPILTAGTVLPTFFVIGFAFIPIGIGMLWFSDHVNEMAVDYTDCKQGKTECASMINSTDASNNKSCNCLVTIELTSDWEGEVFMYYGLTNFYQNHRRYVKSRDDAQLLGNIEQKMHQDCDPFDKASNGSYYMPCGAVANSLFSDHITIRDSDANPVPLIRKGIAWESDKKYKFKNPPIPEGQTMQKVFEGFIRPRDWHVDLWNLDPDDQDNNGLQNEDLIVWMRTAALPNFRKLYRKINHTEEKYKNGMPKGRYTLDIQYRFRVRPFSGRKSIILSTTSILGGKNPFLGIAYITVGSICMLMGVVFLFIHIKCGKQTNDMMNLTTLSPYN